MKPPFVAGVATILALAVLPQAAFGAFGSEPDSNCGGQNCQPSLANNKTHRVDFFNTTTATGDAVTWVLNNRFPSFEFTWQYVDGDDYDVRIIDIADFPNGYFGWVDCPSGAQTGGTDPNRWCYGQKLWLNYTYSGSFSTTYGKRALACHELGHTVGLRHPTSSNLTTCMYTGIPNNAVSNGYAQNEIDRLKAEY